MGEIGVGEIGGYRSDFAPISLQNELTPILLDFAQNELTPILL